MHSIAAISSSSGAASYFTNDNYYTEDNAEPGVWHGEGAEKLGLSGDVDKETFENLLNGILPDGTQVGDPKNRRLGLDDTFSAPKSVSIMALVAGDTRLVEAHKQAVKAAVNYMEKNHAEARNYSRNPNGEAEKTGNLVTAIFTHDTSRALDPNLHGHAISMNLTQAPDGSWKALWNQEIWKNNTTIGQVYHAVLRNLVEKLGYALNAHMVQGVTRPEAIEHIASNQTHLASQRTQNVLNTRATDDMHIVTDDVGKLKHQLDRTPGNKSSSLETVGKLQVDTPNPNPIHNDRIKLPDELRDLVAAVAPARQPSLPVPEKQLGLEL